MVSLAYWATGDKTAMMCSLCSDLPFHWFINHKQESILTIGATQSVSILATPFAFQLDPV
jgi:hypothetical protein